MEKIWNVSMEVSLENFKSNYIQIQKHIGKNNIIMPILKDNGYGSHINHNIEYINSLGIKIIGVAIIDEGIQLRVSGYTGEILVLNQPLSAEIGNIPKYNLIVGVASNDFLKKLIDLETKIKVHIEIETGMGRTGLSPENLQTFIDVSKESKNIEIEGMYTHFSSSDCDKFYTKKQIEIFNSAVNIAKEQLNLKYIHCCNSAGIFNYPEAYFNCVRPGLALLGYYSDPSLKNKIDLTPILKLKSKIAFLKEVPKGTFISYNKSFCAKDTTRIATIPIGYGDGLRRCLSNKGNIVINGKLAPIIGNICMDSFMVDVTNIDANINDDVYIWDNENITVEDIANLYHTINYEVISSISERVPRKFINTIHIED